MGQNTKIEWTHHTFNPWIGCAKVSDGCKHCYAEELMDHRYGKAKWGPDGTRVVTSDSNWRQPLKWNREAKEAGERRRVFCASLADVFEDRRDLDAPRRRLARLIWETPWLDWLFLTKRPEHAKQLTYEMWFPDAEWPKNYWIGTSVENQKTADERIPHLLETPNAVPWVSYEPALEGVDFMNISVPNDTGFYSLDALRGQWRGRITRDIMPAYGGSKLAWVIVGGESGPGARPCDLAWIRSIVRQCKAAGVPVFVKQLGAMPVIEERFKDCQSSLIADGWPDGVGFRNYPASGFNHVHVVLRDKKGGTMSEWPEDLRVREFPVVPAA